MTVGYRNHPNGGTYNKLHNLLIHRVSGVSQEKHRKLSTKLSTEVASYPQLPASNMELIGVSLLTFGWSCGSCEYPVNVTKEFQRRAGIKDDGVVGSETRAALKKYGVKL